MSTIGSVRLCESSDRIHGEAFSVLAACLEAEVLLTSLLGIRSEATNEHLPANQPAHRRPSVIVPGPGQLDPVPSEHPPPPSQFVEDTGIEIGDTAGAVGEGGEETGLSVGEPDTGHVPNLSGRSDSNLGATPTMWPLAPVPG